MTGICLLVMSLLVYENSKIAKNDKKKFYLSYFFMFLAMISEWGSIYLNGAPSWTSGIHRVFKASDYIFTPMIGYFVVCQISKDNRIQKMMITLLSVNAIFQFISIFTGWTFYVDENNFYHHGPIHILYILIYIITIIGCSFELYRYGKKFKSKNRLSLFGILLLVIFGVVLQGVYSVHISYLILTTAMVFLFIHEMEFTQMASDADLMYQQQLLNTDALTGVYSRYSYTEALKHITVSPLLVVYSIDINELKQVNDTYGHLAGDEIIQGAAECIMDVLGDYGKCYRTGGDEFIAFLYIPETLAYKLKHLLMERAEKWHGYLIDHLSLSVGYEIGKNHSDLSIEKLIHLADEKMYEAKAEFYMQPGKNRRLNRKNIALNDKQREYMDIISAFASDVTGLYVIDRFKREVTAYRLSAVDHRIQSGVPLEQGFDVAMEKFIDTKVHPDDKEVLRKAIQYDFIERELSRKKSFMIHFRTLIQNKIEFHCMKCIKNIENEVYDKIIVSFCPEDNAVTSRALSGSKDSKISTVLIATNSSGERDNIRTVLQDDYNLLFANNSIEAIDLLNEHYREVSIVLLDEMLECISFLEEIKNNVFLLSIPIVLLSNGKNTEIEKQCIDLGVIDLIRKPFNSFVLKGRVRNIIQMKMITETIDEIEMDDLTGVYTKQAFLYHAKTLLDTHPNKRFTILILDIQNFKIYNEIYGEAKGDELLKTLTQCIKDQVGNGLCARYGADRFICLIESKDDRAVQELTRKIQSQVTATASENVVLKFGIYENVEHDLTIARMCDRALVALKSIKHNSERSYAFFDEPLAQQQYKAQMYESQFKSAIDNNEFVVWYQPKYNPYTEKAVGAEALVRWKKQNRFISPGEFLPAFEENGLISQLDEYVFEMVCKQHAKWKEMGKDLVPISVNLSRTSIHQIGVAKRYKQILDSYGLPTSAIPIEITESAAIGNMEITPFVNAFNELGFQLHMDDFGSGNSSVAGLTMLHIDTVKFDKSLINFIGDEHGNLVLMYTIALAKELGLHVVAEGVETKEQLNYLKDIGCETIQGYYFNKPMPVDAFENEMKKNLDMKVIGYDYRNKFTAVDSVIKRAMDRVIHRMPGGFFTYKYDEYKQILSSNSYLWHIFGCESEEEFMELVGGSFKGMVAPEDYDRVEDYIRLQLSQDVTEMDYVEYAIIQKDGTRVKVVDYGHLDHQADGDIFYVFISEANKIV